MTIEFYVIGPSIETLRIKEQIKLKTRQLEDMTGINKTDLGAYSGSKAAKLTTMTLIKTILA